MIRKYIVQLDAKERGRLEHLVGVGRAAACRIRGLSVIKRTKRDVAEFHPVRTSLLGSPPFRPPSGDGV